MTFHLNPNIYNVGIERYKKYIILKVRHQFGIVEWFIELSEIKWRHSFWLSISQMHTMREWDTKPIKQSLWWLHRGVRRDGQRCFHCVHVSLTTLHNASCFCWHHLLILYITMSEGFRFSWHFEKYNEREIVHLQAGQCGNQIRAKVNIQFFCKSVRWMCSSFTSGGDLRRARHHTHRHVPQRLWPTVGENQCVIQ